MVNRCCTCPFYKGRWIQIKYNGIASPLSKFSELVSIWSRDLSLVSEPWHSTSSQNIQNVTLTGNPIITIRYNGLCDMLKSAQFLNFQIWGFLIFYHPFPETLDFGFVLNPTKTALENLSTERYHNPFAEIPLYRIHQGKLLVNPLV